MDDVRLENLVYFRAPEHFNGSPFVKRGSLSGIIDASRNTSPAAKRSIKPTVHYNTGEQVL